MQSLTSKDCDWIGSDCKSSPVLEKQLSGKCVWVCLCLMHESLLSSLKDKENQDLAVAINSVVVHSRFVDSFDELFIETCDLSFIGYVLVLHWVCLSPSLGMS